ncbi:MAG: hypothetical protein ACHP6H_01890 [Legionellales bacterium]
MHAILQSFKMRPLAIFVLLSGQGSLAFAAVNLAIVPNGPLPTTVFSGGQVTANFTVTNKTSKVQNGFVVKGLPSTVTQKSTSGNCAQTINLAPAQQCNLALTISGEVTSSFALCSGSSCSTSSVPLNVSLSPSGPKIQLAAGFYLDSSNSFVNLLLAKQSLTGAWTYPIDDSNNRAAQPADISNNVDNKLLSLACNANQSLCLVGGMYQSTNTGYYPLIGMSTDGGDTWTYPVSSGNAPANIDINNSSNQINSLSCSSTFCIGAGTAGILGSEENLIAQTADSGSTWSFPSLPPAADQSSVGVQNTLLGTSCIGSTCYAAGDYDTTSSKTYLVIYQGNATGSTVNWSVVLDDQNPATSPSNSTGYGVFRSISCNTQVCIAGGSYSTVSGGLGFAPVIAQNTGTNNAWIYSVDWASSIWPSDFLVSNDDTQTGFQSTSCSDNICAAAGFYTTDSGGIIPMIAQSTNNGASWSVGISSSLYPAPDLDLTGDASGFASVSCSNTICIAGGTYLTNGGGHAMMLAQSTDQGATWTYPISVNNQPSDVFGGGFIYRVSCQDNVCIATGAYESGDSGASSNLFLTETTDGGQTWTFEITGAGPLPANFSCGVFYSAYASATLLPKWLRELNQLTPGGSCSP